MGLIINTIVAHTGSKSQPKLYPVTLTSVFDGHVRPLVPIYLLLLGFLATCIIPYRKQIRGISHRICFLFIFRRYIHAWMLILQPVPKGQRAEPEVPAELLYLLPVAAEVEEVSHSAPLEASEQVVQPSLLLVPLV